MALAPTQLEDMPAEVIERVLVGLGAACDLAAANAAARLFRGAPLEHALRERARARGHEAALPATLPVGVSTWTEELFARERVSELARAHACPASAGGAGLSHVGAFACADGAVLTCGEERVLVVGGVWDYRSPAALGHSELRHSPVRTPRPVRCLPAAVRVRALASGFEHVLALTHGGGLHACGANGHGQLGLGDTLERRSFVPIHPPDPEPVVCVAAGTAHSVALTAAGCAYSWGYNGCGQLGHGDAADRAAPARVHALRAERVGGVAAGAGHTLFLTVRGAVHSCGVGVHGRLGHGDEQQQRAPLRIEALAAVRATHVSAGDTHSLVVDAAGDVHAFGQGDHGGLGLGHERDQLAPARVSALARARAVRAAAGASSSAVVLADGSVRAFGRNCYGQLGLGHRVNRTLPEPVAALAPHRVVCCSLGGRNALYVTADGAVHSCGEQSGALGHGVSLAAERALMRPTRVDKLAVAAADADASLRLAAVDG